MPHNPYEEVQPQKARVLWQVRFAEPIGPRPLPLADGVVVPLKRGDRTAVRRLSIEEGQILWEADLEAPTAARIARTGYVVGVPLVSGRLVALSLEDGRELRTGWESAPGELADPVYAARKRFYLRVMQGEEARLAAFERGRSQPCWNVADPTDCAADARLIASGDLIVVAGTNGSKAVTIAGLHRESGELAWRNDDGEGRLNDVWASGGLLDVVTDGCGVMGMNISTGKIRTQRFSDFPFEEALAAGDSLLMMTLAKGKNVLFCFNSLGEHVTGRLEAPIERLIGACATEALVRMPGGLPVLLGLPELRAIEFPEAEAVGSLAAVSWSRDVAYLVSEDHHTLTALDLDIEASERQPATSVP